MARRLRHPASLLLLMLGVILGTSGDQEDRQGNVLFIRPPPPSYPQPAQTSNHIHQYQYSEPGAGYNQVRIDFYLRRLHKLI